MKETLIEFFTIKNTESFIIDDLDVWNILYYLYNDDQIIYVGQSKNVNKHTEHRRIYEHLKTKSFNNYIIRRVPINLDIDLCETYEIIKHKPIENKILPIKINKTILMLNSIGHGHLLTEDLLDKFNVKY